MVPQHDSDPLESLCAIAYCGAMNARALEGNSFDIHFDLFCAQLLNEPEALEKISEGIKAAFPDAEEEGSEGND